VRSHYAGLLVLIRQERRVAVAALHAGALSYVPKEKLRNNLCDAMGMVMAL
jgi:hypothetical protein